MLTKCLWVAALAAGTVPLLTAAEPKSVTVAADGSGQYTTVQAAVDAVPDGNTEPVVIRIKPGTYKGKLRVSRQKTFVTFRGEDAKTTILTNDWNARRPGPNGTEVGTSGSASVVLEAPDFTAENVTFENTAGDTGQAVALLATGDRQAYRNCRFLGWQDTLYANGGRQYYGDCHIEGRVDFIFGAATAVFERCTIHSKNGGHVTAASTPQNKPWGYVFLDCKLTGEGAKADLGRPWRPYGSVTYVRCEIGDHIKPEGWNNWGKAENEKTARYAEYKCTGPGADRAKRVPWARELTDQEAEKLTVENLLSGADKWSPRPADKSN